MTAAPPAESAAPPACPEWCVAGHTAQQFAEVVRLHQSAPFYSNAPQGLTVELAQIWTARDGMRMPYVRMLCTWADPVFRLQLDDPKEVQALAQTMLILGLTELARGLGEAGRRLTATLAAAPQAAGTEGR